MFEPEARRQALELPPFAGEELPSIDDVSHPVQAYLNALAPSSRRPQLSALDWIARRSTQVFTAESMPWQHLRRPHVLKIRGLLEEHYQPASANRMLSALRGVLKECWHAQLMTTEEYQAAIGVPAASHGLSRTPSRRSIRS
jgi:hypothetical protein